MRDNWLSISKKDRSDLEAILSRPEVAHVCLKQTYLDDREFRLAIDALHIR
jgi:hypothetical protein